MPAHIVTSVEERFGTTFKHLFVTLVPDVHPSGWIAKAVDKFILQLELQLADRGVHIELDDEARQWLVDRGYANYGDELR